MDSEPINKYIKQLRRFKPFRFSGRALLHLKEYHEKFYVAAFDSGAAVEALQIATENNKTRSVQPRPTSRSYSFLGALRFLIISITTEANTSNTR